MESEDAARVPSTLDELGGERLKQTLNDEMGEQILSNRKPENAAENAEEEE